MTIKRWMTISAFSVFCCGNNDQELTPNTWAPMPENPIPVLVSDPNTDATLDLFDCVVPAALSANFPTPFTCSRPLIQSSRCIEGRDFTRVFPSQPGSDVIVLSVHGGGIELKSSQISDKLANNMPKWDRYDFQGHGTPSCLQGGTDYSVQEIASTRFNDPDAVAVVRAHKHAVSIQGKADLSGAKKGTICVGGANQNARAAFILAMHETTRADFLPFPLTLVDATTNTAFPCGNSAGVSRFNIVNLVNQGTGGGLQLELGLTLREALASNTIAANATLQTIFTTSVNAAMSQP